MSDEYKKKIGIPDGHTLRVISSEWKGARKGQDTDEVLCEQVDEDGEVVATYEIKDSTSTYPPFGRGITYTKL